MKEILKRLNWKLILIHFIATWLLIHSFYILSYLHDIEFTEFIMKNRSQVPDFDEIPFDTKRMSDFFMITGVSKFIGLLVAFIISLSISIYRKWFWLNSVLVLLITYTLFRLDFLLWDYLKVIFRFIGGFMPNIILDFLVDGLVMLFLGLLIFFVKKSTQLINSEKKHIIPTQSCHSEA
jgi:hypothetical protein